MSQNWEYLVEDIKTADAGGTALIVNKIAEEVGICSLSVRPSTILDVRRNRLRRRSKTIDTVHGKYRTLCDAFRPEVARFSLLHIHVLQSGTLRAHFLLEPSWTNQIFTNARLIGRKASTYYGPCEGSCRLAQFWHTIEDFQESPRLSDRRQSLEIILILDPALHPELGQERHHLSDRDSRKLGSWQLVDSITYLLSKPRIVQLKSGGPLHLWITRWQLEHACR